MAMAPITPVRPYFPQSLTVILSCKRRSGQGFRGTFMLFWHSLPGFATLGSKRAA